MNVTVPPGTDRGICCRNALSGLFQYMYRVSFIVLYSDQQMHILFYKLSHCYMFRHYHIILRELVINTLPSHKGNSNAAVGNTIYN